MRSAPFFVPVPTTWWTPRNAWWRLEAIRKSKNFEPLAVSFKRIRKILKGQRVPAMLARRIRVFEIARRRELYVRVRPLPQSANPETCTEKKYQEALEAIAGLRKVSISFRRRRNDGKTTTCATIGWRAPRTLLREFTTVPTFLNLAVKSVAARKVT